MFGFAWVDPEDTEFDAELHYVFDEDVFSFDLSQGENEFALLKLTVRNPKIGLLNPSRKVWAWFSYSPDGGTTVTPLFFGRLVGVPSNIFNELVELQFIAKPLDFADQKNTVADELRVLPWYDPIFIDETRREDPDAVLEAYSRNWHTDRTAHTVSTSDILEGEDGTVSFTAAEVLYEQMQLSIDRIPIRRVEMSARIPWQQRAFGEFTLIEDLMIPSYNNMESAWPKPDANIGKGWYVVAGVALPVVKVETFSEGWSVNSQPLSSDQIDISWHGITSQSYSRSGVRPEGAGAVVLEALTNATVQAEYDEKGRGTSTSTSSTLRRQVVYKNNYRCSLSVGFDPDRKRFENVSFALTADVQNVVTLPGEDEVLVIHKDSSSVSETIPPDEENQNDVVNEDFPIGDTRRRSYVTLPRGLQSLEYLILCARAALRSNSRVVNIAFETTNLTKWLSLTLRKNATIADSRLPGGTATGKVTGYTLSLDGDTGKLNKVVRIGCAVGTGGTLEPELGEPVWAEADYTDNVYQEYQGVKPVVGEDVRYTVPLENPNDDGFDFLSQNFTAEVQINISNKADDQKVALDGIRDSIADQLNQVLTNDGRLTAFSELVKKNLEENPTTVEIIFPKLDGEFESGYAVEVDAIKIPKMIDLGAASV